MPRNLSTLLHAYDKITVEKRPYCFLCFKTDAERKLKVPLPYLKTAAILNTPGVINDKPQHICYVCESLAKAAAKYQKATFFATSIDKLFRDMLESPTYQKRVRRLLLHKGPVPLSELEQYKTLLFDQEQLNTFRKSMEPQPPPVIVVDPEEDASTVEAGVDSTTPAEVLADSDCEMHVHTPSEVIGLDDVTTRQRHKRPPPRPTPNRNSVNVKTYQNKFRKIKPKVTLESSAKETSEQATKAGPTLVPIGNPLETAEPPAVLDTDNSTQGLLYPIYKNPDGSHEVPGLCAKIVEGQLVFSSETPEVVRQVLTGETDPDLSAIPDVPIVATTTEDESARGITLENVVKEPQRRTDRIDWEDRIPMDVISCIDATDPHPPSFIQRFVVSGTTTNITNEDVIDLC